ncbi:YeeE/YedE family protein [Arvimicrobium flavum]|uniref:YeeE/YedE family protein n=1 Tax=Arvimicrobium flavum TaxID=3393320 RepID=UPI00237B0336|nr:YeeE/YedE family protein [Mesorhizobium shangrilense]
MTEFTPLTSLLGGGLIGVAAVLLMALNGRVAGLSGILGGLVPPAAPDWVWRAAFLAGAVVAPGLILAFTGFTISFDSPVPTPWLIVGGLIVGVGVTLGSGCSSGHGVCGMARLSGRSIAATISFMIATAATVFIIRHVLGGF